MEPEFKWKTYNHSITISPAYSDSLTVKEKWVLFKLKRSLEETKERSNKAMISAIYGTKLYHHGDPV